MKNEKTENAGSQVHHKYKLQFPGETGTTILAIMQSSYLMHSIALNSIRMAWVAGLGAALRAAPAGSGHVLPRRSRVWLSIYVRSTGRATEQCASVGLFSTLEYSSTQLSCAAFFGYAHITQGDTAKVSRSLSGKTFGEHSLVLYIVYIRAFYYYIVYIRAF